MRRILLSIGFLALAASTVGAQTYPSRPIRLVVPAAAGGSIDILARNTAQALTEQLGQSIIVENRVGASGIVGTDALAKAAPDGYTLGLIPDPTFTIYPHLYEKLPFSIDDFTPISVGATTALAVFAHRSVPANTLQELIALAKANPSSLSFGTPGIGTPMHLVGELVEQAADIKMVHVPYKGGAPAMNDAVAGHIPLLIAGLAPVLPFMRSGDLKALAITDAQRSAMAPDVPTLKEAGLPGVEVTTWFGFFGPAGLPVDIVDRLNREILNALNFPNLRSKLLQSGLEAVPGTPDEVMQRIRDGSRIWPPVIRKAGLRLEL
jgi:tripartite-type tricarboxylate transporter receptor subunit TctC